MQVGDTVQLKSGGPIMTVESVGPSNVCKVIWFNRTHDNYDMEAATLKVDVLVEVELVEEHQ